MSGRRTRRKPVSVSPRGVVLRQSTDIIAIENREVAAALQFIRTHGCERLRVSDVVIHVNMSRTWLEQKLKQILGRTIHEEIQHVRIEKVRMLLETTNMPIKQIAQSVGFGTVQYLTRAFRAHAGCPPAAYRKKALG